jgi:DNA-binding transcriptional MerR regulator
MDGLSIGDLAAKAGVPTSTIRYYERSGLVSPASRSESNYRLYDQEAVDRLRFIRAAQSAGLTLADIKTLLEYRDGVVAPCREVRVLIEHRLVLIEEKMKEFRHVQRVLKSYLSVCKQSDQEDPCQVLDQLDPDHSAQGE